MSHSLRFRQVHLDFHTSPAIDGIGEAFDKRHWQESLKTGHVDSITCFSKCHHGWSYHPTNVGKTHPHLSLDLLRAQFDAAKEVGVNVPVYISAGVDNVAGTEHPEWREISYEGCYSGWTGPIHNAGFFSMCFNTPYLEYLCEQIREVVRLFPDGDGVFLDIIHQGDCCCRWCLEFMAASGLDADKMEDRRSCADSAMTRYYELTTAAVRCDNPDYPVFHNSGHLTKGKRDILRYFSHLELESLPTGGWGYDHFPISAKYAQQTELDYLGMTGKFHTTWGEFGGYKHPNALKYECAAMLAHGAKCSIGDQLHPNGRMDPTTYKIIGAAYADVERKEPWCAGATSTADIGLLSSESEGCGTQPDTGAARVLLEGHFLFDVIDRQCDSALYKLLILPDAIHVDDGLRVKLNAYLASGGRLLLTGASGLSKDESRFAIDVGAEYEGESEFLPDYVEFGEELAPSFVASPLVMYRKSRRVRATLGEQLASIQAPYFNRTWKHFCSHQHAPNSGPTPYAAAVRNGGIVYLAHPIFTIYHAIGAVAYKEYAINAIRMLMDGAETLTTNVPSTARVTLTHQGSARRYVLHLLYANTIARGGKGERVGSSSDEAYCTQVEVIDELLPLHDVKVSVRLPETVKQVTLEPEGRPLAFTSDGSRYDMALDQFTCHQMVVLHY